MFAVALSHFLLKKLQLTIQCLILNKKDLIVNAFNYWLHTPTLEGSIGLKGISRPIEAEVYVTVAKFLVAFPESLYSNLGIFHCFQKQL